MTDDSLQRVIDDVFDEYAEIMNSFLFPFEHCKDCGCHFTQPHDMACIGASILASIPRRCANLKHRLAALSAQTEARDGELWRKLNADCNEVPCSFPCLRDDLADWKTAVSVESGQPIDGGGCE